MRADLLIVGAGPAGVHAAMRAKELGLEVLLVDEGQCAGGQVYRAPPAAWRGMKALEAPGEQLRLQLAESGVRCLFGRRVIHAEPGGPHVLLRGREIEYVQAKAVIVATGAVERFHPFPGWTLPGVVGLAAATAMIKGHCILPGRRVVVAGPGPLGPLVASLIRKNGGHVAALADPNPLSAWLRAAPRLLARPGLFAQGMAWMASLRAGGTPVYYNTAIESVAEEQDGLRVTLVQRSSGERHIVSADAVCAGAGLEPSVQLVRLLGARLVYDEDCGGWIAARDDSGRTTVAGLYVAGDGAGIVGAAAAPHSGVLAALAVAVDLGRVPYNQAGRLAPEHKALVKTRTFGRAMTRLMAPTRLALKSLPNETIVCRCESLNAGTLRSAILEGARSVGALKSATRCGMGPCGGRICGEAMIALIEETGCRRDALEPATARSPIRPLSIAAVAGQFEYDDIPLPEPSPA